MSIELAQQYLDSANAEGAVSNLSGALNEACNAIGCLIDYIEDLQTELKDLRAQVTAEAKTDPVASPTPFPEPGVVDLTKLDQLAFNPKMSSGRYCYYCGVYHITACPL